VFDEPRDSMPTTLPLTAQKMGPLDTASVSELDRILDQINIRSTSSSVISSLVRS